MTIHFDDVLWYFYIIILLIYRVHLAEVVIKPVRVINMSTWEVDQTHELEGQNKTVQSEFLKCLHNEKFFRPFIHSNCNLLDFFKISSPFVHCDCVGWEKSLKFRASVLKSEQFGRVRITTCQNFLESQFHMKIAEVECKNSLFENEGASEYWFIIWQIFDDNLVFSQFYFREIFSVIFLVGTNFKLMPLCVSFYSNMNLRIFVVKGIMRQIITVITKVAL